MKAVGIPSAAEAVVVEEEEATAEDAAALVDVEEAVADAAVDSVIEDRLMAMTGEVVVVEAAVAVLMIAEVDSMIAEVDSANHSATAMAEEVGEEEALAAVDLINVKVLDKISLLKTRKSNLTIKIVYCSYFFLSFYYLFFTI